MTKSQNLPRVAIIIAAYNEAGAIANTLATLPERIDSLACLDVVVIDDGSHDDTATIARDSGAIVVRHSINRGQGAALETGFEFARRNEYDAVVTFDADGQHDAREIPAFVKAVLHDGFDVALGSRFIGAAHGISNTRKMIIRAGILFTHVISRIHVSDTHNGFRALSRKALLEIELREDRMEHASEILDLVAKKKLSFTEIPVTIRYTDYSVQKGQRNSNALKIAFNMLMYKVTTGKR